MIMLLLSPSLTFLFFSLFYKKRTTSKNLNLSLKTEFLSKLGQLQMKLHMVAVNLLGITFVFQEQFNQPEHPPM